MNIIISPDKRNLLFQNINIIEQSRNYNTIQKKTMKNQSWNYYGTLKPMFILLSIMGLFNVYNNPYASTALRMLTGVNSAIRLMWNLSLVSSSLSFVFIGGTISIETHLQGIIYSVYYMANVIFIMIFNFHPKGVKLLTEIKSQSEPELTAEHFEHLYGYLLFILHLLLIWHFSL